MTPLLETAEAWVGAGDWRDLAEAMRRPTNPRPGLSLLTSGIDLLCVDAPYSERTHKGHDATDGAFLDRRRINYKPWHPVDVEEFVATWEPLTRGWFVSITDHVLWPAWEAALLHRGRYVFPPLPLVVTGATVRRNGDGPASWATCACVARPRSEAFAKWGALPGAYIAKRTPLPVVGGKHPEIMRQLVGDYSRPGDLVCDPCCGAGTTLVAAIAQGRRAVGCDVNPEHAQLAADWLRNPTRPAPRLLDEDATPLLRGVK